MKLKDAETLENLKGDMYSCTDPYQADGFEEIGEGMCVALLDMVGINPQSRITLGPYDNLYNLKYSLAIHLMKEPPFRFDLYFRKLLRTLAKNFEILKNYVENNVKTPIEEKKEEKRVVRS